MDRLNLPAGILKELAMQRLKGLGETITELNISECLEYLNNPQRTYNRITTKKFKNSKREKNHKRKSAIQTAK